MRSSSLDITPEGGWEPQCFYVVEVAFSKNNPIHRSLFFSGFLSDGYPAGYNAIYNPSYETTHQLCETYYFKVIHKLGPVLKGDYSPPAVFNTSALPGEPPEDKYLRLCRTAAAQLDAERDAAMERFAAALKAIERELTAEKWPRYKVI